MGDVVVDTVEGMGRVLVANRDFKAMEVVLDEEPLLVWDKGDNQAMLFIQFYKVFIMASEQVQSTIQDMFYPADGPKEYSAMAAILAKKFGGKADDVEKLLSIVTTNCHSFFGEPGEYKEVPDVSVDATRVALFDVGSKVAHSCAPNLVYSSKTGTLRYLAVRDVKKGEQLTFAYIGDLWSTPTSRRRCQLLASKHFLCRCRRCAQPDDCRRCLHRGCGSVAMPCPSDDPAAAAAWRCEKCGDVPQADAEAVLERERELEGELRALKERAKLALHEVKPSCFKPLLKKISTRLSPLHYLHIEALDLEATVCASHAPQLEQIDAMGRRHPFGTAAEVRRQAAEASAKATALCECLAAGCTNGPTCKVNHEALAPRTMEVFHMAQDLMRAGGQLVQSDPLVQAVLKYIDWMYVQYGDGDPDVSDLKNFIKRLPA